jgi:sporulation-control protein spo0M
MSLLDTLQYVFDAGGFGVAIRLDEPLYEDQSTSGAVVLRAGSLVAHVDGVRVDHVGVWSTRDENRRQREHSRTLDTFELPCRMALHPSQTFELPFQRALATRHSFENTYDRVELRATVRLAGTLDASVKRRIVHRPIEPIETLRQALRTQLQWPGGVSKLSRDGVDWYVLDGPTIPERMRDTIDRCWLHATPVAPEHGHSIATAAHVREAAPPTTPFALRSGQRCAIALECHVDRDGAGWSGLKKELTGQDKAEDRYVALDVESALARVQGFIEHVHALGPVR